jgi:hypothetical protein
MNVLKIAFKVNRKGYVRDEDELQDHRNDAGRIVANMLHQMRAELDQAGYEVEDIKGTEDYDV